MSKILMVPVHLDALYLPTSEAAVEPTADFRNLPYYDSKERRDVNNDTPWIGDSVVSPPFENSNMTLQSGAHLHWSLPDGLCRGKAVNGKIEMSTVPNRWLIRRRAVPDIPEKIWVVESDYLWPETDQAPAANIFHQRLDKDGKTEGMPYRFLGRKLVWKEWLAEQHSKNTGEKDPENEYLENLTAIGHGEPTFAAYYPNCMTVFGFHDRDVVDRRPPETPLWETVQYDLLGWYGEASSSPQLNWEPDPDAESPISYVEPTRRWRIEGNEKPGQLLCYASLKLTKDGSGFGSSPSNDTTADKPLTVAVGNTVTEALSALLADEVANEKFGNPDFAKTIEQQLEALHIEGQLASETQDLGLRLGRYRHEKSFTPVSGTERWTVHADPPAKTRLPAQVLDALREFNEIQARHGRRVHALEHARRQLYGDWCNYMRCVYRPPDGGRGQFLDIDEVVHYIETRSLEKVERLAGIVETTSNNLEAARKTLEELLSRENLQEQARHAGKVAQESDDATPQRPTQYTLRSVPGARYWEPNDPVVLVTGGNVQVSERHGRDGRNSVDGILQCETHEHASSQSDTEIISDADTRDVFLGWIEKQRTEQDGTPGGRIAFRDVNVKERPWNPLFLDWGIDLHPAEARAPDAPGIYDPDVITDNYCLGAQNPDLQSEILYTHDDPDRFSGRCILGSTPAIVLRERIEDYLQRRLLDAKPDTWANPESEEEYFNSIDTWLKLDNRPTVLPSMLNELTALVDWYKQRPKRGKNTTIGAAEKTALASDPIYCTLLAYEKLFDNTDATTNKKLRPRAFLGQALSGFNEELIQWKLGLALPIDEPIGLTPYRDVTARVRKAVGDVTAWATEPTNEFLPIRSGTLKLDKLRMVDSFGRVAEVSCDEHVIVPAPYRAPGRPGVAFLPPRLAQPACVTFRWLDANSKQERDMAEEEARSPICGWLLPEKLNGRLLVFDSIGNPLGALASDKDTRLLEWVRAPGLPRLNNDECEAGRQWLDKHVSSTYYNSASSDADDTQLRDLGELGACIDNPRLARVLLYLWATCSKTFLDNFLNTLNDAMANIDPEGATSMGSTALLVGRPVAVIGAELNLLLKDEPAVRQDWTAFLADQHRHRRDTDDFSQVKFRLRLGQYKSRNDGVLGYWLEEPRGFVADTFVAQAADDDDPSQPQELHETEPPGLKARINSHDSGEKLDDLNFTQSVADPPLRVTVLMDPRGRANLTTGILPVKTIDIPRPLWEPALEAIRVWFPTAPILSRPGSRRVPTPTLVDRRWSWLELEKNQNASSPDDRTLGIWQTLRPCPSVEREALQARLPEIETGPAGTQAPNIARLIEKGWLEWQEWFNLGTDFQQLDNPAIKELLVELSSNGRTIARDALKDGLSQLRNTMTGEQQLPDIPMLIEKGWLQQVRLDVGSREDRQELDDRALEAPLDALLAQLALALVSPGDEADFNSGVEVREGWLQLDPGRDTTRNTTSMNTEPKKGAT